MADDEHTPRDYSRMAHLFPDHPVRDGAAAFEFEGFAKTLAELALNPANRTPFTAVVRGGWGRGKTTLLCQTQRILNEDGQPKAAKKHGTRQVKTLWFNAWKYPAEDSVLAGLLGALLDQMRREDLLTQLASFIDQHKGWALGQFLKTAFPTLFRDGVPMSRYAGVEAKRAFFDTFTELFGQLGFLWFNGWSAPGDNFGRSLASNDAGDGRTATIAVFLDDLDRCRSERVLEVLETINLFLDMPGVCFYLGLDWKRVIDALTEAKKKEPAKFLEKLIQVAIDLPEVSEPGAAKFSEVLLAESPHSDLIRPHLGVIASALESRHPRHVKRFLNDLSFRLALLRNTSRLGTGDHEVSEAAVVAWHLFLEALGTDQRRDEFSVVPGNLEGLLNRFEAWRGRRSESVRAENDAGSVDPDEKLFATLREPLAALYDLKATQRHPLLFLGSPTSVVASGPDSTRSEVRPLPEITEVGIKRDRLGLEWVRIPAGSFDMGSKDFDDSNPIHRVTLSGYEVNKYPVTNEQYAAFVSNTGLRPLRHWLRGAVPQGKALHPVVNVSWEDARRYCEWASNESGQAISLPSEAQWEYAARGREGRLYPWGGDEPTDKHANFGGNVGDTTPVSAYPKGAAPEGVLDLAGNVWEWCADWYGPYEAAPVTDPTGPAGGSVRVVRGGAFGERPDGLRAARRGYGDNGRAYGYVGFRCVRSSPGGSSEA